jgi:hypothetical protein
MTTVDRKERANAQNALTTSMDTKIPNNFFYYWSGDDFQFVNYLSLLSLVQTTDAQTCEVYYENAPKQSAAWARMRCEKNVRLRKLDFKKLIDACGLDPRDFSHIAQKAHAVNRSDLFRYLILFSRGGVYLDFDTIISRDLAPLLATRSFAGFQPHRKGNFVNGSVMGAQKKSPVIAACLDRVSLLAKQRIPLGWVTTGPELLTRLLYRAHLPTSKRYDGALTRDAASGYTLYPSGYFYHYPWRRWRTIFRKSRLPRTSFVVHFWRKMSKDFTRKVDESFVRTSDSLYAMIARRYLK